MPANTFRQMPTTDELPYALYTAEQVRRLDHLTIHEFGIAGLELMERAGRAAFKRLQQLWPQAKRICVVTGVGNNAGDGFVLARLAQQAGLHVDVLQLGEQEKLGGDARINADRWWDMSGSWLPFKQLPLKTDVIVDAIFGTGLQRDVTGSWAVAIEMINAHAAARFALDIPSGLNADNGQVMGTTIKADATITFIGLKRGMFTGAGREYCGQISFDALAVPAKIFASEILSSRRLDWAKCRQLIRPRQRHAHKGDFGHVLVVGGNRGYSGAVRLAAEAAARCGAGLVSIATHPAHAAMLNNGRPELMVSAIENDEQLEVLLAKANAVVLGPGLGQNDWAEILFRKVMASGLPLVLDADGLNLLARHSQRREHLVITPHPGEASRLLGENVAQLQADRFVAVEKLQQRFACTVVLKGSGSLIASGGTQPVALCSDGNPGMASGGMGDVLSGMIAAFLAQGFAEDEAAELGVSLHARAADVAAAEQGEIGLLASDLFPAARQLLNE
ncbi:MAG: NAD(P)H-hydrate dehydratase [Chromatiales bacterium]|jgi:NAD(P)H-hydrate epimerase